MTTSGKTFKEQKPAQEKHEAWRANREGKRQEREKGGHTNLLREALEEELEEEAND